MKTIFSWQSPKENSENTGSYDAINVILNHDFSKGLHLRHTNCCNVFVVPACSSNYKGVAEDIGCSYTIITNCTECWKGLQQDFTSRISAGCVYVVSARVVVSGTFHGSIDVQATLRLVYQNAEISYLFISKLECLSLSLLLQNIIYETSIMLAPYSMQKIYYERGLASVEGFIVTTNFARSSCILSRGTFAWI
ncbi:hypothetical protein P3S68_001919 [Capsicum galapagoense]